MRGVTSCVTAVSIDPLFQLTRLMRGVTNDIFVSGFNCKISTHTPHARRDRDHAIDLCRINGFQLTRLMRGVTISFIGKHHLTSFQLTRLMRGVTPSFFYLDEVLPVSTPHAEGGR